MSNQKSPNEPASLGDILKNYALQEKLSKQNAEAFPIAARAGIEVRIRQAKDRLPKLRLEYLTAVLKSAYGFFLEGEDEAKKKAFVDIGLANGAVSVDAGAIYEKLADLLQPTLGPSREFSVTQVGQMDYALRELVEKTGYDGTLNRTVINELRVVKDRTRLVNYIQELIARSNGSTPVVVAVQADVITQAIAKGFSGKRLVVLVSNAASSNRAAIGGLFRKNKTVDVDTIPEVNEESAAVIFRDGLGLTKAS